MPLPRLRRRMVVRGSAMSTGWIAWGCTVLGWCLGVWTANWSLYHVSEDK